MSDFENLQQAVMEGDKEKILEILQKDLKDVDLKITNVEGDTLLHLAFKNEESSQEQLIEILEIFLDRGIDVNIENNAGKAILHLAVERRMRDVIDLCLQRNACTKSKYQGQKTIAHFAVEEECRKLHSCRNNAANFQSVEKEGSSFIDWMVSKGFDFFHNNRHQWSPLDMAIDLNLHHILLTLLKCAKDLPAVKEGPRPLLYTFYRTNKSCLYDTHQAERCVPLQVIPSTRYEYRHVYEILKIILNKSNRYDDESLDMVLRTAIRNMDPIEVIELLAQRITNVNFPEKSGVSLVETFADSFNWTSLGLKRKMSILRMLILKGADINKRDGDGQSVALKLFSRHRTLEMLEILKEGGADFSTITKYHSTFFNLISLYQKDKDSKEVKMIDFIVTELSRLDIINIADSEGRTLLHAAIIRRNEVVALELINHGAKINIMDNDGRSLLDTVCQRGLVRVLQQLIERGVDLDYRDKDSKTLLHLALSGLYRPCGKMLELLIKHGLDVNARDKSGKTPLYYALDYEAVRILFKSGAQVNDVDKEDNTPLYDALCRKHLKNMDLIKELLRCGADIRDPKVFKLVLKDSVIYYISYVNYSNSDFIQKRKREVMKYLGRHLIKMTIAGLLDKMPYPSWITEYDNLQEFIEQCKEEVELLKNFRINDSTSLYKLLHIKPNRRCAYVDNEKLKSFVEDVSNEKKFPNYFVLILGCYNEAASRTPLLKSAAVILNELTHLPDLCTDAILMLLGNADMVRFIEAFGENDD